VFTAEDRERLRDELVSGARADVRISAAALIGSSARGREDRWSDIDIALCLAADADRTPAIADWSDRCTASMLPSIAWMWPAARPSIGSSCSPARSGSISRSGHGRSSARSGPPFACCSETAATPRIAAAPSAVELVGMGWLYALHARSSIARGRVWQAEYMISAMRDQVLALACLQHGVPAVQGRGMDSLPPEATAAVAPALVRSLEIPELKRAFAASIQALLVEAERADPGLAARLTEPLRELAS